MIEPTRGENVLYLVLSLQNELVDNVKIHKPLGSNDNNQIHFDIKVKPESTTKYTRNCHKGKYKDMRKYLAKLDWNNTLRKKTAFECWNILKYVIESIIDKFVLLKKKQAKRSRKKHFSKETIRQIAYMQTMWRVYRYTRKDEDYTNYKGAVNAARQSKRRCEQKLACNINK